MDLSKYLPPTREEQELVTNWLNAIKLPLDKMPRGRRWEADDIDDLRQMVVDGCDWERIAFALNRSLSSVQSKWHDLSAQKRAAPVSDTHKSGKDNNSPTIYRDAAEKSRGA